MLLNIVQTRVTSCNIPPRQSWMSNHELHRLDSALHILNTRHYVMKITNANKLWMDIINKVFSFIYRL